MRIRRIGACLIVFILCGFFQFGHKTVRFDRFTIEDGLSQNTIFSIIKGRNGFFWFGTEDGLNRFDGYTFKVYRHNPDDPSSLSTNWIQTIYEDSSGYIWAGTDGGGLNRFDSSTGLAVRFIPQPQDPGSIAGSIVWAIVEGDANELWVGTDGGLNRVNRELLTVRHWRHQPGNGRSLSSSRVKALCKDGTGGLWVGTLGGGINHFSLKSRGGGIGIITRYTNRPNGPGKHIYCLFLDSSSVLWTGTLKGLYALETGTGKFLDLENAQNKRFSKLVRLKDLTVTALIEEPEPGLLWIGTYGGGVFRFNMNNGELDNYKHRRWHDTSISCDYIQTIHRDFAGALWFGTDNGLNRLDKKKQRFGHWQVEPDKSGSLSNRNIWAIYKDHSGKLWVGTESGLDVLDRDTNVCRRIELGSREARRENRKVTVVREDNQRSVWVGTEGLGLYELDQNIKLKRRYTEGKNSLCDNIIQDICVEPSGNLWIGTADGLNRFDRTKRTFEWFKKNPLNPSATLSDNYITAICIDSSGNPWIGTQGGLNCLKNRREKRFVSWKKQNEVRGSLSHNHVTSIWEDRVNKKYLWIGTSGGGLNRFDKESGTFKHYLEAEGLTNGLIYAAVGDKDGNLWISTNRGLWKFDTQKEIFKNFDARDGLQGNEFNSGAYYRSRDGEIFFGGVNGFNGFYPREIKSNPHIPPVVVTGFSIFNKPVPIGGNSPLKRAIIHTKEIVLSHEDEIFSFDFAALDYTNPAKNKYAYKMEGFDEEWILTDSKRRLATYTNLDPGNYVFRVIGTNNDGVWNKDGTSIKLIIVPPLWRTWWFTVLLLLGFAVLSYFTIGFVKKYLAMNAFWRREKYVGKYKLLEKIGSGGMGTIYKARNTMDKNQVVAIKVLRDELFEDEIHRRRFKQEAAIIDQLEHPNIIRVIERGQHKQKLFIVMELLEGINLTKRIESAPVIPVREVLEIMIQVMAALLKIHRHNVVHRDLKPDNIMLLEGKDSRVHAKLLDFGLAKSRYQTRITQTGTVLGTINYMSPEQISRAEFSPASDIYAMGVIFYETLTHHVPFPGERITDIMKQIMMDEPIEPIRMRPDIPVAFNDLIMKMLGKKVDDRPKGEDILIELRHILATLPPEPGYEVTQKMQAVGKKR